MGINHRGFHVLMAFTYEEYLAKIHGPQIWDLYQAMRCLVGFAFNHTCIIRKCGMFQQLNWYWKTDQIHDSAKRPQCAGAHINGNPSV
jgi:hypothetical protein